MIVHWTDTALSDLRNIQAYIAQHSVMYAQGIVDRIFVRTALLADLPRLGGMIEEYDDDSLGS